MVVHGDQLVAPPSETRGNWRCHGWLLPDDGSPALLSGSAFANRVGTDVEPGHDAGDGLTLRRSANLPRLGAGAEVYRKKWSGDVSIQAPKKLNTRVRSPSAAQPHEPALLLIPIPCQCVISVRVFKHIVLTKD